MNIKDKSKEYKKEKERFWHYFYMIFIVGNIMSLLKGVSKYDIYTFIGSIIVSLIGSLFILNIRKLIIYLKNKLNI